MKQIPVKEFDDEIKVIVIRKPKHTLSVGPIFQVLKKLEVLRIIEANVASIGMHSFWGVPSLRILGKENNLHHKSFYINVELPLRSRFIKEQHHSRQRGQLQGPAESAGTEFVSQQTGSTAKRHLQILDCE